MQAAESAQPCHHIVGDGAFVKSGAALLGDTAERGGQKRLTHRFAQDERLAAAQKQRRGDRIVGDPRAGLGEIERNARRHRAAFLGQADGRLQQFFHLPRAEIGKEPEPGIDGARHSDGVCRPLRNFIEAALHIPIQRRRGGRSAGTIERNRQPALRRIEDETIPTDTGHVRLGEAEHRRRRDRRIDGIAAVAQDFDGGLRGQRVRSRGHRFVADGGRTARPLEMSHRL